ncbi:YCF48-related protein [Ideonella sp. B508-1]|uniref:WD40/YVTN/BNR-like repeat-containing protein n=1 Tax=Ideonella sp. B508-1 TaxID=137716 RepID=UPI000688C477|nr:YCF48-related protein [Ideonella sp. B508-1]
MSNFRICHFLVGLALCTAACLAQAAFKDPLTTPAMPTARAAQAPLTAIVRAGSRLIAAGWRGVIVVSDDDGQTWRQASVPVSEDFTALSFPTPTHGWVTGNDGILLETNDGGLTWTKRLDGNAAAAVMVDTYGAQASAKPADAAVSAALKAANDYQAQAPARPFLDVAFLDNRTGYLAGTYGLLFKTTDSGHSWKPLIDSAENPDGYNIYAIHADPEGVFLAGELGLVLRFDAASGRFVKVKTPYDGSFFLLAGNSSMLIAAGLRGHAFLSVDQGGSWVPVDFHGASPATFSGATTLPDGRVALVTLAGQLFVSRDQGRDFTLVPTSSPMRYSAVAPAGRNAVAVVGAQGVRIETIK